FNPGWDSTADADAHFYKATAFAKEILDNKIEQIRGDARAQKLVEAALAAMQDGIAVLPRFAPWKRTAKGNSDVQFVVYPDQRGGYAAQAVDDPNSPERALKCPFPLAWAGLREGEIAAVSGIPTLRFCHKSRFLATAESKEDILEACRAAQREQERLHRPIRAVICDCDGTIVSEVQHEPSDALLYELECAKRKGAVVIIASGRILPIIPAKLRGIADYFVCGNGALAADKTGETLFKDAWSTEQTEGFLRFCRQNNAALSFFFEENYSVYFGLKSFCTFYGVTIGNTDCLTDGSALSRHHTEAPYGAFYIGSDVALAAYLTENPDLQAAPFMAGYYDIYKKTTNKAKMIERVLKLSGLNWQDAIAFGDGANDIEMLRCAGTGYAMENAREEAKCAADKIAPPVNEDGVAKVLRELFGTLEL
ncbi:MAG: MYG1 family protein, partial [Pygmaiobacter sp.]